MRIGHLASERTPNLDPYSLKSVLEGKKERERGNKKKRGRKRVFRVRSSHFSLDFPTISPSNSSETRGKVDPHYKSYVWVPGLWSFDKLRKVGVFSYLFYFLAKSHFNGWGCLEAWMAMFSVPKDLD